MNGKKKRPANSTPTPPPEKIVDPITRFVNSDVVIIQKGHVHVMGKLASYSRGILMLLEATVTYNFATDHPKVDQLIRVGVDRTSIQMIYRQADIHTETTPAT